MKSTTDKLTIELSRTHNSCSISSGERVRVRASVQLTFLSRIGRLHRPRVSRQWMWSAFLKRVEDHIADMLLLSLQLPIPKTKFFDAHRDQELCSLRIVSLLGRLPVMAAIKFDGETGFHAVEIEVVNPTRMIASKLVSAETTILQPTPHEFFSPCLLLAQRAGAICVGHDGNIKRRGCFRKNGFYDRPHPGHLSQERGNRSPALRVTKRSCSSIAANSELPERRERQFDSRIPSDAQKLFPLPGGEGQGEGECHTNFSGGFKKLVFTTALTPAFSPRRGRIVRRRSTCRTASDYSTASVHISNSHVGGAA